MSSRTLEQWIALYNKKIPEGFKRNENFSLFYLPDKGFAEIGDTGKMIIVYQVCGVLKFWRGIAEEFSRRLGYKVAGTYFIRPIRPYIRLAGFEIDHIEETAQGDRFFCYDKRTNQQGVASPVGKNIYRITWEVTANGILF